VKKQKTTIYGLFLEDNCLIKTYLNSGYPLRGKVFEINFGGKFRRAPEAAVAVKNSVTNG
jgi:hypothetical protein